MSFPEDQTKERICDCLKRVREQNPAKRILLVLDNHFAHTREYTRKRAHRLGIDLVFLPVGSLISTDRADLEEVEIGSISDDCRDRGGFRALVEKLFSQLTNRVTFAQSWIGSFLSSHLQKLP